jgi:transposase InsO family protein
MLDADIVAVSLSSLWRVLGLAGLLSKWNGKPSKKGTGFEQPLAAHQHWHIDVSYINISGTFYYLCSILDGCSRYIVNWDLRESMTEADIEIILERAKEQHPEARPRIISDNGPQFIAKDFKEFIRISGMTHVRTSPFYPQSNGKSNVGTNRSKGSASGRKHPSRWRMHGVSWRDTWITTTTSA